MKLESLESIREISPNEIVNDSVEPLKECTSESSENLSDSKESIESMQSRFEMTEIVTDLEMTEGIAEYLKGVDELKFENWCKLTKEEKEEILNKIEQKVAEIEHRPPLKVELEDLEPRNLGYQSSSENKIVLNNKYVNSDKPEHHREVIDTIIHEGRHAYQHYNTDVKTIHESISEVRTWHENFYNPIYQYYRSGSQKIYIQYPDGTKADVDYRLYYQQPVETDARNFSHDVMAKLERVEGFFSKEHLDSSANDSSPEMSEKRDTSDSVITESDKKQDVNDSKNSSPEMSIKSDIMDIFKRKSPFESRFDAEHPFPTYEQLRNAGFSPHVAKNICYGITHSYSQRELFECLYNSKNPVEAYNKMMKAKVDKAIAKTDELIKGINKEFGL